MRKGVIRTTVFLMMAFIVLGQGACVRAAEKPALAPGELPLGPATEIELELREYKFIPNHFEFDIGKLYKLKIHNAGKVRHELSSPVLAVSVLTIGVDVVDQQGGVVVTFRGRPTGIELLSGQTVNWWFFPLKGQPQPKEFTCDEPGHLKHGMRGTFIIK